MVDPQIVTFPGIRVAGLRAQMSFDNDATATLWQTFGPLCRVYSGLFGEPRISAAVYPPGFFEAVEASQFFEKWAAAPFEDSELPDASLEWLQIPPGLYAVFEYRGKAAGAPAFFDRIFREWLPASGYRLDSRPHFEILPPDYRPDDPEAREDVYIPVRCG